MGSYYTGWHKGTVIVPAFVSVLIKGCSQSYIMYTFGVYCEL